MYINVKEPIDGFVFEPLNSYYGHIISESIGYSIRSDGRDIKYHDKLYEREMNIGGRRFLVRVMITEYEFPRLFRKPFKWSPTPRTTSITEI